VGNFKNILLLIHFLPQQKNYSSAIQQSSRQFHIHRYVDMDVVDFLRKFQENNLLANVQLDLSYGAKFNTIPMLKKVLPLISSIYSIYMDDLFDWIYDNDDKELNPLLKTMVAQTKILSISRWLDSCSHLIIFFIFRYTRSSTKCTWEDKMDWCCSWLYSPRDDGKPRTLISEFNKETHCSSFIDRIKKVIFN
jgi:hypothetical protein